MKLKAKGKYLGDRLRSLLSERGLTQRDLASNTGISYRSISNYVRGISIPHPDKIRPISAALGVEVAELGKLIAQSHSGSAPYAHTAPTGDDLAESAPEHGSRPQKPLEGLISKNEIEQFLAFGPDTRSALIRIGEIMDEARRATPTD
jgi:transcriptional regulator with XRE-family HTH domain